MCDRYTVTGRQKALVLSLADPRDGMYGGTLRAQAMLDALTELEYDARLLTPGTVAAYGERLRGSALSRIKQQFLPMPTMAGARSPSLDRAISEQGHTAVAVCQVFQQARYLEKIDSIKRWLDFSDLYSTFGQREALHRRGLPRFTARLQAALVARQEIRYSNRAHIVTAAGYGDTLTLQRAGIDATWLPTPTAGTPLPPRGSASLVVGFLGNFDYWPNSEAYQVITQSWLPRWGPTVSVAIAGRHSQRLEPVAGVSILGQLDDVGDFYKAVDIVLAPIERGGGMKVKISEALTFGRPVVATPAALDGFAPEIARLCLVSSIQEPPTVAALHKLALTTPADDVVEQLRWPAFTKAVRGALKLPAAN
jgi:hypothetical protein